MQFRHAAKAGAVALFGLVPGALMAGGYGNTAVMEGRVGQSASAGDTVWCQRLKEDIPVSLYGQMDCGPAQVGTARAAVAGDRVTNRPTTLRDFFSGFRNVRQPREDNTDNGPTPKVTDVTDKTPKPEPTPKPKTNVTKWERLDDFGVTPENYGEQSPEFREKVGDYLSDHGPTDDWSGFNPN